MLLSEVDIKVLVRPHHDPRKLKSDMDEEQKVAIVATGWEVEAFARCGRPKPHHP